MLKSFEKLFLTCKLDSDPFTEQPVAAVLIQTMNYKSFSEFLNCSREPKEMLGTSSLLRDQTGDHQFKTAGVWRESGDQIRTGNESK